MACAETDNCLDDQSSVAQTGNHKEHEKKECGKFCNCSCCVHIVSVSFQSPIVIIAKPVTKNKFFSFYDNISLQSNYFGNIWQPPKIG